MISTRGRYALRMMLDLAANQGEGYVALKDVAARQGISKKYLEQIIPVLNRAGLLQTARGLPPDPPTGGIYPGGCAPGNGGHPGQCGLPGGRGGKLPPAGGLPDLSRVARPGQGGQRLPGFHHPPGYPGPAAKRRGE